MTSLTEFLLARIADEERLAHDAASEGRPRRTGWQLWTSKVDTTPGGERLGPRGSVEASPARVLAECEAKSVVVRDLAMLMGDEWDTYLESMEIPDGEFARRNIAKRALRALATVYASHADYRSEWAPDA